MERIIVTGIGIISSLGTGLEEHRYALKQGVSGIELNNNIFKTKFPVATIKKTNAELFNNCEHYKDHKGYSRVDLLAKNAFQLAIKDAKLTESELTNKRTAFISSSTVGGMSNTYSLYEDATSNGSPSEFITTYSASHHLQEIISTYKMKGPTSVINTACSSSANSIMLGAKMLQQNKVDVAIVGGVDCLSEFTVKGFNSLGILTDQHCTPFDENRKGLNLGEAAVYLVLEKEKETKTKYGVISGWSNTNDSYHSSALNEDGTGIINCISKAMKTANLTPTDIDYINAHGTGTGNNDLAELTAISNLFEPSIKLSSTKPFTGHTLAAAGALEAVFSILSIQNQEIYPSLNIKTPLSINQYTATTNYSQQKIKHVLSNSFGFNGNCSSLIISEL